MPAHMSSAIRTDTDPALPVLSRVWSHSCCCLHHCPSVTQHLLLHPSDLPRCLQDRLTGKNGHVLADPLPADNAFLIHEEEHPPSLPALQALGYPRSPACSLTSAQNPYYTYTASGIKMRSALMVLEKEWLNGSACDPPLAGGDTPTLPAW